MVIFRDLPVKEPMLVEPIEYEAWPPPSLAGAELAQKKRDCGEHDRRLSGNVGTANRAIEQLQQLPLKQDSAPCPVVFLVVSASRKFDEPTPAKR